MLPANSELASENENQTIKELNETQETAEGSQTNEPSQIQAPSEEPKRPRMFGGSQR